MTLIVPKWGLEEALPWAPDLAWFPYSLGRYKNCCNLPSLTSCFRWFHKILQSSVVCRRSWWYWEWRLWLHLMGPHPILFDHLNYGSFLIFSKTWCTSSRNTVLTTWGVVDPDCPTKSLQDLLLLYLFDLKSLLSWGITLVFPLLCCWSSSTRLYSSIRFISWHSLPASWPKTFSNHAQRAGRP